MIYACISRTFQLGVKDFYNFVEAYIIAYRVVFLFLPFFTCKQFRLVSKLPRHSIIREK